VSKKIVIVTVAGFSLLMLGLLILGYLVRPRPLGGAWWTAYPTDDYSLKYVCIQFRDGRVNPFASETYIAHPLACEGKQMDQNIRPLHSCTIEGEWQKCTEPTFEDWVQFPPEALEPGQFLDLNQALNLEELREKLGE
jgi:hypothetical protein